MSMNDTVTQALLSGIGKIKLYAGGLLFGMGIIALIFPIAIMAICVMAGTYLLATYYIDEKKAKKTELASLSDEQLELEINGGTSNPLKEIKLGGEK